MSLLLQPHQGKLKEMSADPNVAQSALYRNAKQWSGESAEPGNFDPVAELMKGPLANNATLKAFRWGRLRGRVG